jgi:hypothetical protein
MTEKPYEPEAFKAHFNAPVPDLLYHYTGQSGLIGITGASELWATKIQYMNDATEFGLALGIARTELENIATYSHHTGEKAAAAKLLESLRGLEDINIFAVCFCEKGDLLSQWRGYSGGNHGYAIGFDPDMLMQLARLAGFTLGPCIYDPGIQRKVVQEAIQHCITNELDFTAETRWGFHGPLADILFRCGVFFKDASFTDEKEWRLVSSTCLYDDDHIRFRSGKSMVTPFYALRIAHEDGLPIRQVVVGPCPHMELAKSAVTSLLMRHGNKAPLHGQQIAFGSAIPFRDW